MEVQDRTKNTMNRDLKYKRILLKISGEALAGPAGYGLDGAVLKRIAGEIKAVSEAGVELLSSTLGS